MPLLNFKRKALVAPPAPPPPTPEQEARWKAIALGFRIQGEEIRADARRLEETVDAALRDARRLERQYGGARR